MTEFVLYGGKGGVGKTTLAAATGMRAAREGDRTLVVSTDPAHSIADAYESPVEETPTRVTDEDGLHAMEIDPRDRFERRYGDVFERMLEDVESLGVNLEAADVESVTEHGLIPGADEIAVVDLFAEYDDHPEWDVVVFDTAPTGHTLRLLELPNVMDSTMGTLLNMREQLRSLTDRVASMFGSDDDDDDDRSYSEQMSTLQTRMEEVADRLRDGDRTVFRVVTIPEPMAITETDRLLGELGSSGITVDHVLANKVLQDPSEDCPTCWPRHQNQQAALEEARGSLEAAVREVPLVPGAEGIDRVQAVTEYVDPVA
jgi:arsenite-transporting ATPase